MHPTSKVETTTTTPPTSVSNGHKSELKEASSPLHSPKVRK